MRLKTINKQLRTTLFQLTVFAASVGAGNAVAAQQDSALAGAISHYPAQQVLQRLELDSRVSLMAADKRSLQLPGEQIVVRDLQLQQHSTGTISYSGRANWQRQWYQLLLTEDQHGSIAELRSHNRHLMLLRQASQLYLLDLTTNAAAADLLDGDVPFMPASAPHSPQFAATTLTFQGRQVTVVDIMMLYATEVTEQYPDGLAQTLMHHLVAKANQAFADSDIAVQLRLVHSAEVNYRQPSNFSALQDLSARLQGRIVIGDENSLANVRLWREQYGADLVAMIRTHNLNEREVCGVAYFPQTVDDIVINISNVGSSGGSNCIDTFTHEIGHNFGAGHQFINGQSVGAKPYAGALIVREKFNTIMSSIGSGDENRGFKLNRFSNPDQQCAGRQCGSAEQADNSRTINEFALFNSSLREAVVTTEITPLQRQSYDTDNDGVNDEWDAYPHNAAETADSDNDGIGDNSDAFPLDSNETLDSDADGIGNNSDPDDDNDGVPDSTDKLPFDPRYSADADGDGIADEIDALPNNAQDYQDADTDGIGNRFDADNDNDGVADFDNRDNAAQQLLVLNAANGKLTAFTLSGQMIDTLYQAPSDSLTFRTDLTDLGAGQLAFIQGYDVMRLSRYDNSVDMLLYRFELANRFPSHLLMQSGSGNTEQSRLRLIVAGGMKPSALEQFGFTSNAVALQQQARLDLTEAVVRDVITLADGRLLLALRDRDQLVTVRLTAQGITEPVVWAHGEGLHKPEQMAVLQDGSVLVTNAGTADISRFSATGQFMSVFIPAGSGGLAMPGCIAVDNANDVYVCSTERNEILKFSGANGAPQGVLLSAENGDIATPVALLLVGYVLDSEPLNPLNDTDGDGVANQQDAFPLDASRSVQPEPVEPEPGSSSGGALYYLLLILAACLGLRYKARVK